MTDLGQVAGVPFPYGAITFSDANTFLIIGCDEDFCGPNVPAEGVYQIPVVRDGSGHITGFDGTATQTASGLSHVEAGMGFGPGGVLFYNDLLGLLGEIKPGSSTTDKLADLTAAGVCGPYISGLAFAPNGQLKVISYSCGGFYTIVLSPDGSGTYDIATATQNGSMETLVENFTYVPNGSPVFAGPSLLETSWPSNSVSVYSIDSDYNPTGSAQPFAAISGAYGSTVDPVTNDLLITTWEYGTSGHVYRVSGFAAPSGVGAVSFTPVSLNAKNVVIGSSGLSQNVTLTNSGNALLKINQITASGDYSETDDCSGSIVAPGGTCTISVAFSPSVAGVIAGAITVNDDGAGSPHVLALTGKGIYPVTSAPISINFGSVPVGTNSAGKTVTLTNNTNSPANFTFAASPDFAAAGSGSKPCNGILAAKAKCTLSVTFAPTANGSIPGALSISGATFPTQLVALSGTGTGGGSSPLTFSPASLTFSATVVGATSLNKTLTVTNSSNSTLTITNFVASADYFVTGGGGNPCGGALGPGASCTLAVTFSPSIAGKLKGGITVMDNAAVGTQIVPASGTAILPVTFKPAKLTFSAQAVGTSSPAKSLTLTNNQEVTLSLLSIVASGNYTAAPGGKTPCAGTVAPHSSCTLQVTFTPSNKGTIKGVVTVGHDAAGSPQVVGLNGTGQ